MTPAPTPTYEWQVAKVEDFDFPVVQVRLAGTDDAWANLCSVAELGVGDSGTDYGPAPSSPPPTGEARDA